MAGDWIKFEVSTPEKQEVLAITVAMGWDDPDLTVGKLLRVWRWFDQQTVEGNAPGVSAALLDRIAGVSGFAKAMADVGWLIIEESGISLPNFGRHNGKTAKDRALTAKRVAAHKAKGNGEGNAQSVSEALPREREEKNKEHNNPNGLFALSGAETPPGACPHQQIIALYHERLPMGTQVRVWSGTRAKHLQARWREDPKRQSLEWWDRFFAYIAESEFLTGQTQPAPGRDPFVVSLDWLVSPQNFAKVVEGRYHRSVA